MYLLATYFNFSKLGAEVIKMNTAKDIEKAIESLPSSELRQFRVWFAEFDSGNWDSKIEEHAASGKLDQLGKAALAAHQSKKTKEI